MTIHLRDVEVAGDTTDVVVDGSRIVAVAPDIPSGADADVVIDGRGGALVPGLHDHHLHLVALAAAMASIPVGPHDVRDARGFAAALQAADARAEDGAWLRAVGYQERVAGDLDRWALDRLVPDRPVRVQHRSGALWIVNSAGLARLDLLDGPWPDGCELGDDGAPTGRLWRMDAWLARAVPAAPPDLGTAGRVLLAHGVTSVTDMTPYEDGRDLRALANAVRTGELLQDVTVTGAPELDPRDVPSCLHTGPAKILLADHDLPSLDELVTRMRRARRAGRPIAVHCVTRVAFVLTITAFAEVGTVRGDRIEHGAVIPRELDATVRDMGLAVVTQPNFVRERGDEYLADVEPDDREVLWRCGSLIDAGVQVAGGTDAPFGRPDPWALIRAAISRRTIEGRTLLADERIAPSRALALVLGTPHDPAGAVRRVAVGAPADLCLLHAPLVDVLAAPDTNPVRAVVRGGQLVFGPLDGASA